MNYEPNTTHWNPGDLVLHDADAKREDMLMRVVGYTPDGLCVTEYVDDERKFHLSERHWFNDLANLHDPARFGVTVASDPSREAPDAARLGRAPMNTENPSQKLARENNFVYHPPKPGQAERYARIRAAAGELAALLNAEVPPSRELSLSHTKLEEAVFWANAGIARNE